MRDPMWDYRGVDKDEISGQSMNTHDFNNYRPREDRLVALNLPIGRSVSESQRGRAENAFSSDEVGI